MNRENGPASYIWIGGVWENNWLKFKTSQKVPIVLEESMEQTSNLNEAKPKDHNT